MNKLILRNKKIKNFLRENWFRLIIILILLWIALSFSTIVKKGLNLNVDLCPRLGLEAIFGKRPSFCK
jgi:ABC-type polysaccharide transport system permease subunit